jgi:hypothetical protein
MLGVAVLILAVNGNLPEVLRRVAAALGLTILAIAAAAPLELIHTADQALVAAQQRIGTGALTRLPSDVGPEIRHCQFRNPADPAPAAHQDRKTPAPPNTTPWENASKRTRPRRNAEGKVNHPGCAGDSTSWEGWVMSRRSGSYAKELRERAVQVHYNTVRLHAGLKYVTPDEHSGGGDGSRKARRDGLERARLDRLAIRT